MVSDEADIRHHGQERWSMSRQAFQALSSRIRQYLADRDGSALFTDAAMQEANDLIPYTNILPATGQGSRLNERELAVNQLVGAFFYFRATHTATAAYTSTDATLGDVLQTSDFARAKPLLLSVYLQAREAIPPELHPLMQDATDANRPMAESGRNAESTNANHRDGADEHEKTNPFSAEAQRLLQMIQGPFDGQNPDDIQSRIGDLEESLNRLPPQEPVWIRFIVTFCLAQLYVHLYLAREVLTHIDKAVALVDEALSSYVDEASDHEIRDLLKAAIHAHRLRFDRLGDAKDIDSQIVFRRRLAQSYGVSDEQHMNELTAMVGLYAKRYELLRDPSDLDPIVEILDQTSFELPQNYSAPGHRSTIKRIDAFDGREPARKAMILGDFASGMLQESMDQSDKRYDLPILLLEAAVEADPSTAAYYLSNLSGAYSSRFEVTQAAEDLDAAVDAGLRAIEGANSDAIGGAIIYQTVGQSLMSRSLLRANLDDGRTAIRMLTSAAEHSQTEGEYAQRASALGVAYRRLYTVSKDVTDLEQAVRWNEVACETVANDAANVVLHLNLAATYLTAHKAARQGGHYLDRAISKYEEILRITPSEHPVHIQASLIYGSALNDRIMLSNQQADWDSFKEIYAGLDPGSLPVIWDRITVLRSQGKVLLKEGDAIAAAQKYFDAIRLLAEEAVPSYLPIDDRARILGSYHGFVCEAVEVQIKAGRPEDALLVAETGRGVILGQRLNEKVQLTELRAQSAALAQEFAVVRDAAREAVDLYAPTNARRATSSRIRYDIDTRMRGIVRRIRMLDGLEDFFGPPATTKIREAIGQASLVLVNCTALGASAIVVAPSRPIQTVALPLMRINDVQTYYGRLINCGSRGEREIVVREILTWLWHSLSEPILHYLGLRPLEGRWPRIWWIPMGLISAFPLHAAGAEDGPSVLDYAISSYSPTAKTLISARQSRTISATGARRVKKLIVAVPNTQVESGGRQMALLSGVSAEASNLSQQIPEAILLDGPLATVAATLDALPSANWLHFAGHAVGDLFTPTHSRLVLQDGEIDVAHISRIELTNPELVYLSACDTAKSAIKEVDEAITIASAFQMAGYRNAVASLWPLHDSTASEAAGYFYAQLIASATGADGSAAALHRTLRQLRDAHPNRADLWSGLVHFGP
jgi:tetratricopeptide (TPR) repeat protein